MMSNNTLLLVVFRWHMNTEYSYNNSVCNKKKKRQKIDSEGVLQGVFQHWMTMGATKISIPQQAENL